MVASIAAAALALAACGNADDEPDDNDGIQDIETPDEDTSGPNESTNNDDGEPTEQEPADEPDENGDTNANGDDEPEGDNDSNGDEDLYAVPDDIDIDYVQTVFDELTRIDSEHLQSMLEREVPVEAEPEDHDTVEALYGGPYFDRKNSQMVDLFFGEEARQAYLPAEEIGSHRIEVMHLHEVHASCVTVFGWWDLTDVATSPLDDDEYSAWVIHRNEDDNLINSTGWEFWDETPLADADTGYRVTPDEWDEIDLGDSTATTCEES